LGRGRSAALVSFRLGGPDGVSVVADHWRRILTGGGWEVRTVAGEGAADVVVPGLAIDADEPPGTTEIEAALDGIDVVVVENLCSLPLNPSASEVMAEVLAGRPALMHHHDLPWQRERFAEIEGWPPTDRRWRHVAINDLSRRQLADRGVKAIVIRNGFDIDVAEGDGVGARAALGLGSDERLAVHPVRAIPRKDVPTALEVTARLAAHYWLLGGAEEGYGPRLAEVLTAARCPVHRDLPEGVSVADAYAASSFVLLPSMWEGFGNPVAESALHRRPLAIRRYPVALELEAFGFRWFDVDDPADLDRLDRFLEQPDQELLDHNHEVVRRHFSTAAVAGQLLPLMDELTA
jgi:glycosyltransferase involved in cell wall biosynthesis